MALRIGNGYDIHRLVSGRPLILGGQRLERTALDLDKVRPDLAARGPVNPQPRNRAISRNRYLARRLL